MKDDRMGEEVCACIQLKSGEETTPEEIKAFCKGQVGASTHLNLLCYVLHPPSPCPPLHPLSPPQPCDLHPDSHCLPLVCRSPTSRFPATSCLSTTTPSPSQERCVRWSRQGRGGMAWGPGTEGQGALTLPQGWVRAWRWDDQLINSSWFAPKFSGFSPRNPSVPGKPRRLVALAGRGREPSV